MAGETTIVSGMAGRYALALFELARDGGALDAVSADLKSFIALVDGSPDLTRLVRSPVFGAEEQGKAVAAVLAKAGIGGIAGNVVKVMAGNRRLFAVGDMAKQFSALVAAHKGEAKADVTVAEPLSDAHMAALKQALAEVTGKNVDVSVKIEPAIIGGIVVKLGSRMVDASLRTKLNSIKQAMKEVG